MNDQSSLLFNALRPSCIELSKIAFLPNETFDPNSHALLKILREINQELNKVKDDTQVSTNLADYVFVPIGSLLKQESLGDSQVTYLLHIIANLLRLCWSSDGTLSQELAKQLLPILSFLISPDKDNKLLPGKSTNFKEAGIRVFKQFFFALSNQNYKSRFFLPELGTLPALGHVITIILTILVDIPRDLDIQLDAVLILKTIYQDILKDGEILSYILPGNVSKLTQTLVLPGKNINYKLAISILRLLGFLLSTVYDDLSLEVQEKSIEKIEDIIQDDGQLCNIDTQNIIIPESIGRKHRNTSWLRATSAQVLVALQSFIPKLIKRENNSINQELIEFASNLLIMSSHSLRNCNELLVTTLLVLHEDPKNQLSSHLAILKKYVNEKTSNIKNMIAFEDEVELKTLDYAIKVLLDNGTNQDIIIDESVSNLTSNLYNYMDEPVLKQRPSEKIIVQSSNVIISSKFNASPVTSKQIAHLLKMPKIIENSLCDLINHLGNYSRKYSNIDSIIEDVINNERNSDIKNKTIALWISIQLVKGVTQGDSNSGKDQGIDEFLDFHEGGEDILNIDGSYYTILECCGNLMQEISIASEGIALTPEQETTLCIILLSIEEVSKIMKENFKDELIDYLFIIVDSLASPSPTVREYAQSCSMCIANQHYNGSVQDLLTDNVDYLVEGVSNRLNLGMTDRIGTILMVVSRMAGYETIKSFNDVIDTIFRLLEYYHGYAEMCIEFFELFEVIIEEIKKKYMSDVGNKKYLSDDHLNKSTYSPWNLMNVDQLSLLLTTEESNVLEDDANLPFVDGEPKNFQEYFDSRIQSKADIDSDDEEEIIEGNKPNEPEVESWISPIPKDTYRFILQIASYGERLLTHSNKQLRCQIMKTIKLLIPLLATQYNSLLPQVAQLWNSVCFCCLDSDPSIVLFAAECLKTIIMHAGNFISKRFVYFWDDLKEKSDILREIRSVNQLNDTDGRIIIHHNFPPITKNALVSISNMLLEGITVTESTLSEGTLEEIIFCCIHAIPISQIAKQSNILGDIVWAIQH